MLRPATLSVSLADYVVRRELDVVARTEPRARKSEIGFDCHFDRQQEVNGYQLFYAIPVLDFDVKSKLRFLRCYFIVSVSDCEPHPVDEHLIYRADSLAEMHDLTVANSV